jgi:hypothetical protein
VKYDQLNDEQLSLVTGGTRGGQVPGNAGHGHGNGTGGGDGLGWLRNLIRAVDKALRF